MNDSEFQFSQPAWIALGLVLVSLGLWMFRMADRRRIADLDKLAHPRFQQRLIAGWSPALRWIRRGLWLAAILLLAVAAARPQLGYEWREVKRRGIDILFAVDTSRSMLAEDLTPNRLERARLGILDFLNQLEGDRVGLVPFAGSAFALCPLTLDYGAFRESLNSINTNLIPRQGTDLASAIREGDRLFDEEGNNQRFLVLITDGEDLQGEALAAAEEAKKNGTTIYTVGVGAADGQAIPVRDQYGRKTYLRDENGKKVQTKLDEQTLREIAEITGGLYVPLGRGAEGLDAIYQKRLALAPKSELAQKLEKVPLERFQWPLGAALLMLALQALLGERKPERKRKALVSVARRVRPVAILAAAFVMTSAGGRADVVTAYNDGTKAYESGEYEQAAEQLRSSLETPDLSLQQKSYYNLGNSLFRIGQGTMQEDAKKTMETWKQAIKAYDDSLALEPTDGDAKSNRDFVQRKLDELKQQESKDQQNQDQEEGEPKDQEQDQKGDDSKDGKPGDEKGDGEPNQQDKGGENEPEGQDKSEQGEEQKNDKAEGEKPGEENSGMKGQEEKQPKETPKPTGQPGEAGKAGEKGEQSEAAGDAATQGERVAGEMSKEEAMRLLDSLGGDERIVVPVPLTEQNRGKTTKGKTW
ncbi:MAG: VWA domain-containing protein [Akkermansiaceae bacterium]|nr:VWA domain-containing protein [Akkermansiaceae bacterium]